MSSHNPEGISMDMHGNLVYPRMPAGVFAVGDMYDAQCECGWEATGFEEPESADEVLRIHKGDDHCADCGAMIARSGGSAHAPTCQLSN